MVIQYLLLFTQAHKNHLFSRNILIKPYTSVDLDKKLKIWVDRAANENNVGL